jgi:chromosome segregation ATPase
MTKTKTTPEPFHQGQFRLSSEGSELQQRYQVLNGNLDRKELLQMIELKQDENKRKEDELQTLNTKLWDIQKSLGDIEDERQGLTEKASRLASEKVALQRQLENREKEIMSLSRRCGTQANKMKESTKLRAANADLSRQVDQLKAALKHGEDKFWNLNVLQAKLKECQESRDDLSERLGRVKNDHDAVAENLRSCLATVNQLTEEKSEWEEERRPETRPEQPRRKDQRARSSFERQGGLCE